MRFAYIDSQGNEVGIPSVEALQLRIELGAIGAETEFYDANADRWAPAGEHEIFRTLKRELEEREEGGFVAPPPPTLGDVDWPGEEDEADEAPAESEEAAPAGKPLAPNPFAGEEDPDADTTAAEAVDPPPPDGVPVEDEPPEDEERIAAIVEPEPPAEPEEEEDDPFDFGDFGALDLSDELDQNEEPLAQDVDGDGTPDLTFTDPDGGEDEPEGGEDVAAAAGEDETAASFDFSGGLELEESFADRHGGEADEDAEVAPSGMEMEEPLSEYDGDDPPDWMEDEDASGGLELEDAAMAGYADDESWQDEDDEGSDAAASGGAPAGRGERSGRAEGGRSEERRTASDSGEAPERRPPKARPAAPRRKSSGMPMGLVAVIVVALGAGGFFGWRAMSGGEPAVPEDPPVEIPEIPGYLQSTLDEAAGAAYATMLTELRARGDDLPAEPSDDWLSGNYLANASRFEGIERYWQALGSYLTVVEGSDEDVFMAAFTAQLDSLDVQGNDRDALLARARAGFQSARPSRREIYGQLEAIIASSLGLHDFLLANEQAIDYEPAASGLSRDPVTEAVPASDALGDQMWDRVSEITAALDALGALDRVTTERLLEIFFRKLNGTSID